MTLPRHILFATLLLCGIFPAAIAQNENPAAPPASTVSLGDACQLVEMPAEARKLMRQDMQDHLVALSEILANVAAGKLDAAAEVAETRMGESSMGKHRASGFPPGRFMPDAMRDIGWGMHEAASDFAAIARKGDAKAATAALQRVMNSCVACHYSYRTQ